MTTPDPAAGDASPGRVTDEAAIRALVHGFYDTVRADPLIGPVFAGRIAAEAWPVHLAKMCDFWSSVLMKTSGYEGRPLPPHLALGEVGDAHFQRWLALFRPVARRVLPADDADKAVAHAERMANSFRLAIAFQKGEDTTRIAPLPAGEEA